MRSAAQIAVVSLFAVAFAGQAFAGGMEVGDTGGEAMGRGGAFVAKADNPAAINYNPAGFAKLRGHHTALSANVVYSEYNFHRAGFLARDKFSSDPAATHPQISSEQPWFAAPVHLMLTTDFGYFRRVTFAAGLYVPPATARRYPAEMDQGGRKVATPTRFDMLGMEGLIFYPSVAIGIKVTDWFDLGFSLQGVVTKAKVDMIATVAAACETPEDPTCDVAVNLDVKDMFSPTGSVGFLMRPDEHFELGGMLRLPSASTLKGKAKVSFGPGVKRLEKSMRFPMVDPVAPPVELSNNYPWMFRLGARYIFRDGAGEEVGDIEANLVYERWSDVSTRSVAILANSLGKPMESQQMDFNLKDTYSLRLGGSYRFSLNKDVDLTLRAGAFGETASTEVSDTRLQIVGARRLGLTAGLGLRWGSVRVDVAYAKIFFPTRVVAQSSVTAQDFGGGAGPVVGNGTYSARYDALSLQVGFSFGQGAKRRPRYRRPRIRRRPRIDREDEDVEFLDARRYREHRRVVASARTEVKVDRDDPRDTDGLTFAPEPVAREVRRDAQPRVKRSKHRRVRRRSRSARSWRKRARAKRYRRHKRSRRVSRDGYRRVRTYSRALRTGRCLKRNRRGHCVRRARR